MFCSFGPSSIDYRRHTSGTFPAGMRRGLWMKNPCACDAEGACNMCTNPEGVDRQVLAHRVNTNTSKLVSLCNQPSSFGRKAFLARKEPEPCDTLSSPPSIIDKGNSTRVQAHKGFRRIYLPPFQAQYGDSSSPYLILTPHTSDSVLQLHGLSNSHF